MQSIFDLPESYSVMSPVHIPRGFTKAYIAGKVVEDLGARIHAAHREFADHDVLLIEGTGHAGVGAVIGLSNAVVAAMLGAPAVIVSEGGVGRPIDEIVLNAAHFPAYGVRVAGAIVNKVRVDEQPGIEDTLRAGPREARDPAARRAAVPADPVEPDAGHDRRGRRAAGRLRGHRPRAGHRQHRDRRDGAPPHARARGPDDAGHRPGRPRGRDPHAHDARTAATNGLGRFVEDAGRRDAGRGRRPARTSGRSGWCSPAATSRARGDGGDPAVGDVRGVRARTTRTPSRPRSTTSW